MSGAPNVTQVRVRIPSKINLFLAVRDIRPDGYHDLVTILQTISLYDTIQATLDSTASAAHPAARRFMELEFTADAPVAVPTDGQNLAVRAAYALMDAVGVGTDDGDGHVGTPVTRLHLTKRIPVAGGMAGGSADAAATLVALNRLWEADLDPSELRELAASLGADVPFCVAGGTAIATGIGTATAQVLARGVYHWVVAMSDEPLHTPDVYRAHDALGGRSRVEPDAVLQALREGDAEALGAALHNDLEPAAFALLPELVDAKRALLDAGALGAVVSGSGPTVVGLAASAQHASTVAQAVEDRFDRVEVAMSPAGGPELAD